MSEYENGTDELAALLLGGADSNDPKTLLNQAQFALLEGDLEKAAGLFEKAIAAGKDDPGTLLDAAKVYMSLERPDTAIERLQVALPKAEDHLQGRSIHLALSRAYEAVGDEAKAKEHYRSFQDALTEL